MALDLHSLSQYKNLEIIAKRAVEGFITGKHKSPYHGFSVEFSEHKSYTPGDELKNIDWKVFAKTDKLYVKKFEEETNLRCQIVIDVSSSMYLENEKIKKIDFSVFAAAALSYLFQKQRDAFGVCSFDKDYSFLTPIKSTLNHLRLVLGKLQSLRDQISEGKGTGLYKVLQAIAGQLHRRSLVVVFTDFFDSQDSIDKIFQSIQELKFRKHEVLVFHVLDYSKEVKLDYSDKEIVFVDKESGDKIQMNPKLYREEFEKKMSSFCEEIKVKCGQNGLDYIPVDTAYGLDQVLVPYLNKRVKIIG